MRPLAVIHRRSGGQRAWLSSPALGYRALGETQRQDSDGFGGDGALGLVEALARSGVASQTVFPGVSLEALQFLHEERHILFHGHEPLDTDTTPTLEGEAWLMHNGYAQAEGVANLDKVPEKGCLIAIGYPKFAGGLGGYARYIAICPAEWKYGVSVGEVAEAPLPTSDKILQWDNEFGMRVRNNGSDTHDVPIDRIERGQFLHCDNRII